MALLRESPPKDAVAAMRRTQHQRVTDQRARDALRRRLDRLERDTELLEQAVHQIEHAVPWLAPQDRPAARRRLRALGHGEQLDALRGLRDTLNNAA